VRLRYLQEFGQLLPLDVLRNTFSPDELLAVRPGNRLSIVPVDEAVAQRLLQMLGG
jgi:predicted RNA-binding protein with PUA-like domain